MLIGNYGIHKHEGVSFLHQVGGGGSNFVGLKQKSPFTVDQRSCNHHVPTAAPLPDAAQWKAFMRIFHDPLVQVMFPLPRAENDLCFYVNDIYDELGVRLVLLSKMSSPIGKVVQPAWTFRVDKLQHEMSQTNIQPLVLTQATVKSQGLLDRAAKLSNYEPRTVVFTGDHDVIATRPCKRISTLLLDMPLEELAQLPMEGIGAALIRRYCRNERLDSPMESRTARRDRMIAERIENQ